MMPPATHTRQNQHRSVQPLRDDVGIHEDPGAHDAAHHHHGRVEKAELRCEFRAGAVRVQRGLGHRSEFYPSGARCAVGGWRPRIVHGRSNFRLPPDQTYDTGLVTAAGYVESWITNIYGGTNVYRDNLPETFITKQDLREIALTPQIRRVGRPPSAVPSTS